MFQLHERAKAHRRPSLKGRTVALSFIHPTDTVEKCLVSKGLMSPVAARSINLLIAEEPYALIGSAYRLRLPVGEMDWIIKDVEALWNWKLNVVILP